jgi:hypothetical protein
MGAKTKTLSSTLFKMAHNFAYKLDLKFRIEFEHIPIQTLHKMSNVFQNFCYKYERNKQLFQI